MNPGELVWLPEHQRTSAIPSMAADVCTAPGVLVSVRGGWAVVRYPVWGEFACGVDELVPDDRQQEAPQRSALEATGYGAVS